MPKFKHFDSVCVSTARAALNCSISPSSSFLICLLHKYGFMRFPEASHSKIRKQAYLPCSPVRQEHAPRQVGLTAELRLRVRKSSLIFSVWTFSLAKAKLERRPINHSQRSIGRGCTNRILLTSPPGSTRDGVRRDFPAKFAACQSPEHLRPEARRVKASTSAHRSLLLRLPVCPARPRFIYFSHLTICDPDKVGIPAQKGN